MLNILTREVEINPKPNASLPIVISIVNTERINKKIKIDNSILRNLIIKYKKLNLEMEYFNKEKTEDEKAK